MIWFVVIIKLILTNIAFRIWINGYKTKNVP